MPMKSIQSIKIHHVLYMVGAIVVGIYFYGMAYIAINAYISGEKYRFDLVGLLWTLHILVSPFVLAYHTHAKHSDPSTQPRSRFILRQCLTLLRIAYLIYIAYMPMELAIGAFAFLYKDFFGGDSKEIDIDSALIFLTALGLAVLSFFIIWQTFKYR